MSSAIISAYYRTPFQPARRGAYAQVRSDDLAIGLAKALVERTGINPAHIEDLKMGCAFPEGEQGFNLGRMVVLGAGLPDSVGGVTMNRFCGSSMQAIHDAAGAISLGAGDVFLCMGTETMSRIPMTGFNPAPNPALYEMNPDAYESMGITAENLAEKYHVSRQAQDEYAHASHVKAGKAQAEGKLAQEIIPLFGVDQDGCIRPESTPEELAKLEPVFNRTGTVTAGTSSPLTDGASAVLLVSEAYADQHGLPKLARIKSTAVAGCAPGIMGIGPVGASNKALARAGLTMNDMDLIELNEAFAAQALSVIHDLRIPLDRLNIEGGAIALGHPLGASGARITGKLAHLLKRDGKRYGLATMCIGGGQGIATVLEAC